MTDRKLKHYLQEYPIAVLSGAPLSDILNNSEATGRVAKWGIELSPWDITYKARDVLKSQVLADFIPEWTEVRPRVR